MCGASGAVMSTSASAASRSRSHSGPRRKDECFAPRQLEKWSKSRYAESERIRPLGTKAVESSKPMKEGSRAARRPSRAMTSESLRHVLDEVSIGYDWVLIDTPPVGLLSDAKLVAAFADGVVLVVLAGRTPAGMVQGAAETLGRERVLGVVLNRAEPDAVMGGYGYYHNYGHYYGTRQG